MVKKGVVIKDAWKYVSSTGKRNLDDLTPAEYARVEEITKFVEGVFKKSPLIVFGSKNLLALVDGKIAGFVALNEMDFEELSLEPAGNPYRKASDFAAERDVSDRGYEINGLAVGKEYRRRGIARTLLEEAAKTPCGERSEKCLFILTVNPKNKEALNLYHNFGFEKITTSREGLFGKSVYMGLVV